ncbi:MAG: argininosuccinate synthase [Candidatus Gracilibacteria bacterium]|jgi:argininosuccinate synthase
MPTKKLALVAFSGGLDTSFCVVWLREQGFEVNTVTVNTGGFSTKEIAEIALKAKKLGSKKHFTIDESARLLSFFELVIKANYLRGGVYPACVGPERIVAAEAVAKLAREIKADTIAHGSTGAGNDQVRFDTALRTLAPQCEISAPIRQLCLTREEEIAWLKQRGYEIPAKAKDYSINVGLLGTTIGGKETLTSHSTPPDSAFPHIPNPEKAADKSEKITLGFTQGSVTHLNGKKLSLEKIITELNKLGIKHGIGRGIHLGATILGFKGRVAFEAPAALMLIQAHRELEKLTLTSRQIFWKDHLGQVWGDMIHEGLAFDPVCTDIVALIESSQTTVSGEVFLTLYRGNISVTGCISPNSLMDNKTAVYGEKNLAFDGRDAEGFCKIYGLEGVIAYRNRC